MFYYKKKDVFVDGVQYIGEGSYKDINFVATTINNQRFIGVMPWDTNKVTSQWETEVQQKLNVEAA